MKKIDILKNAVSGIVVVVLISLGVWQTSVIRRHAALNHALCVAAGQEDAAAVERLLARGANPNAEGALLNPDGDCNGQNEPNCGPVPALIIASVKSGGGPAGGETVNALLRAGADANIRNKDDGMTALMWASNSQCITLLLAHGANVNLRDHSGMTALMYAADNVDVKSLKILLAAGADINAIDKMGRTPLRFAGDALSDSAFEMGETDQKWQKYLRQSKLCVAFLTQNGAKH